MKENVDMLPLLTMRAEGIPHHKDFSEVLGFEPRFGMHI